MTNSILDRLEIRKVVEEATVAVNMIDWAETFQIDHGACIPVSVFVASFLNERGINTHPVEAGFRIVDPFFERYAETDTADSGEQALNAKDEKGRPFIGHLVSYSAALGVVFDMSLPTQRFKTLGRLGKPDCLVGTVDKRKGEIGFRTELGRRGEAIYRIYPRRDGWKKRDWPFEQIQDIAKGMTGKDST